MGHKKNRSHDPRCEGRFSELRGRFYEVARAIRNERKDPLWAIINYGDLSDFVERAWADGSRPIETFDVIDSYVGNRKDALRGDPLVGQPKNLALALMPFVFEALRETLLENVRKAEELTNKALKPGYDLDSLHIELNDLTYVPIDALEQASIDQIIDILNPIAHRDFTVTSNAIYPGLIDEFAALYVIHISTKDKLRFFHRGVSSLDTELGIPMDKVLVPSVDRKQHIPLAGYFMKSEFGTGPNTTRTQVASAPYRVEVYKAPKNGPKEPTTMSRLPRVLGDPIGAHVFGMSFYLRHPNILVLNQIQEIAGAKVPSGTTDGLCGLVLIEKIARALGMQEILAYSHHTNPVRMLYPDDSQMANILKINFDESE